MVIVQKRNENWKKSKDLLNLITFDLVNFNEKRNGVGSLKKILDQFLSKNFGSISIRKTHFIQENKHFQIFRGCCY